MLPFQMLALCQRPDGRWEARYTAGRNPKTGKQIQKSIYGTTQKEVLKKLHQVNAELEAGTYIEPTKMTLGTWLDVWLAEYQGNIKQGTLANYTSIYKTHLKPELGFFPLQKLNAHNIQTFYNQRQRSGSSAKTVRNIHGVLNSALQQAILIGYVKANPATACTLPRVVKKDLQIIADDTR